MCRSFQAIEAFAWLNWLILMGYAIALLVLAILAHNRGNQGIWRSSVRDTDFFGHTGTNNVPMQQHEHKAEPSAYGTPAPMNMSQGYASPAV